MNLDLPRAGGAAAVMGGALWSLKVVYDGLGSGGSGVADPLFFILPLLFGAGLAAVYARYSGAMNGEGTAGFVQSFAGLALLAGGYFIDLTLGFEGTTRVVSFGFIILTLGLLILGFAMLKTEPLPAFNFLPLALGMLTPLNLIIGDNPAANIAISALFGLGWLSLGVLALVDGGQQPEVK